MTLELYQPSTLAEACCLLKTNEKASVLAGGTDLLSRQEKGIPLPPVLVCLAGLGLDKIQQGPSAELRIGALSTHSSVITSNHLAAWAPSLVDACKSVGSPQVRNLGTLGGNLCNASPAADSAAALLALRAVLHISGPEGNRFIPAEDFFLEPGRITLQGGEVVTEIILPSPSPRSAYFKFGQRRAMDIAVIGVAVALTMEGDTVTDCSTGLSAVAPTPLRARKAEALLTGQKLTAGTVAEAARAAASECSPVSDHRASADYRRQMIEVFFRRAVWAAAGRQQVNSALIDLPCFPTGGRQVKSRPEVSPPGHGTSFPVTFKVNGEIHHLDIDSHRLLVDVLREDLGLTGTKKSCGEGECGACTVLLDGLPVNSCLVLAATLTGREITTIEGLSREGKPHPLQTAFIREGAVQCGYCSPGMLMSAQALLQQNPAAGEEEIKEALSGNLCRCTGYYKIIRAVQAAGRELA